MSKCTLVIFYAEIIVFCLNREAREVNFKRNVSLQNRNNTNIRSSETTTPHISTCTTMFIIHDESNTWSRSYWPRPSFH